MALEAQTAELWRIPLFSVFDPEALRELAAGATLRSLRAGDVLFRRGEAADCGFVFSKGAIAVDGGAAPNMILHPPALIGEIALIAPTTRPVTVTAREASSFLTIPRPLFRQTLEKHPATALRVRHLFKDRLEQFAASLRFAAPE